MGFTFSLSLYNESKNTISLPTKARPTTNANMYIFASSSPSTSSGGGGGGVVVVVVVGSSISSATLCLHLP
jgi:hypothetical protein